jgi:hypothetical protein
MGALVVEAREHLGSIHAELHDLERHPAANGLALLGQIHRAHATFAQGLHDPIAAEIFIRRQLCGSARRPGIEALLDDRVGRIPWPWPEHVETTETWAGLLSSFDARLSKASRDVVRSSVVVAKTTSSPPPPFSDVTGDWDGARTTRI